MLFLLLIVLVHMIYNTMWQRSHVMRKYMATIHWTHYQPTTRFNGGRITYIQCHTNNNDVEEEQPKQIVSPAGTMVHPLYHEEEEVNDNPKKVAVQDTMEAQQDLVNGRIMNRNNNSDTNTQSKQPPNNKMKLVVCTRLR